MNRLEEFRKRYLEHVGSDNIVFDWVLIYNLYDFLNHRVIYKNKKYFNVQIPIKYITGLEDHELELVKNIHYYHTDLFGEQKELCKDITHYIRNETVQVMLDEYIVIERKRKIKEIIG